jgi:hypothetical protein
VTGSGDQKFVRSTTLTALPGVIIAFTAVSNIALQTDVGRRQSGFRHADAIALFFQNMLGGPRAFC